MSPARLNGYEARGGGRPIHQTMTSEDYHVEISGIEEGEPSDGRAGGPRPWLGIRFDCCGVYQRVYRNESDTAYVGRCPRCLAVVRIHVGPSGTPQRFFRAE